MMSDILKYIALGLILCPMPIQAAKTEKDFLALKDPKKIGQAIAIESDRVDQGFKDYKADMVMTLRNAAGEKSSRKLRIRLLEQPGINKGDKSLIIFDSPNDIKGTALLSYAEIDKPDSQWIYLPSLKRVKRISTKNKSGPFVASEFAYEDITGEEVGKFNWVFNKMETCPNRSDLRCYQLTTTPKYGNSGYSKRDLWMDTKGYRIHRLKYYDKRGSLLKTLDNLNFKKYLSKHWRAGLWKMKNHQTKKSTEIKFNRYSFATGLNRSNFNKSILKRVK